MPVADNRRHPSLEQNPADPDVAPLLSALRLIPTGTDSYGKWWAKPEGKWLYSRIESRVGRPVVQWVCRVYGPRYDSLDVANSAVDILSVPTIVESLLRAKDPWAYLFTVLKRELINQTGGYFREEIDIDIVGAQATVLADDSLTSVRDAVALTTHCLRPHTPKDVLPHLEEMVFYFAERGHSNLSRLHTVAAREQELIDRGVEPYQIRAVANAVLGSRPNHGETSILGAFIQDREWSPERSTAHARALEKYALRMAAKPFRSSSRLELVA